MTMSTDLNAGDFLVSTGLSYPKLPYNKICYSNFYKRNNYLSEIFVSSKIQTLCTLFIPKCFTYKQISFFKIRNSPLEEFGP